MANKDAQLQSIEIQLLHLVRMNEECKTMIEDTNKRILQVLGSLQEEMQDSVV